jgi:hypothetical protein
VADAPGVAVVGVEGVGSLDKPVQLAPKRAQLGDAAVELGGSGSEQIQDVAARSVPTVPEGQDAPDLAEGQSDGLSGADEGEAIEGGLVVVAVARVQAAWGKDQADVFVVADRLGGNAGSRRDFSDAHLPLDLPVCRRLYRSVMEIDLLYIRDCPNRGLVRHHLDAALSRTRLAAVVREHEVNSSEEAERLGMRGSPTILIDGQDPFAGTAGPVALSCRLHRTDAGQSGVPTVGQLVEALGG